MFHNFFQINTRCFLGYQPPTSDFRRHPVSRSRCRQRVRRAFRWPGGGSIQGGGRGTFRTKSGEHDVLLFNTNHWDFKL